MPVSWAGAIHESPQGPCSFLVQEHVPWHVDENLDIRAPRIAGQMRYAVRSGRGLAVRAQQDRRDRQILPLLDAAAAVDEHVPQI
jgi:hypothetical protein